MSVEGKGLESLDDHWGVITCVCWVWLLCHCAYFCVWCCPVSDMLKLYVQHNNIEYVCTVCVRGGGLGDWFLTFAGVKL